MLQPDLAAASVASKFFERPNSITFVQTSENHVYKVDVNGRACFLRLTPAFRRTVAQLEAELEFVRYLGDAALGVSLPLRSLDGRWVEPLGDEFLCTVFEAAPGYHVEAFSDGWNEKLFVEWGRSLGRLHALSSRYDAPSQSARWHWNQEPALAECPVDTPAGAELQEVRKALSTLDGAGYGLIHGDFGRINFHVDEEGKLTVFDFDDCCHHFFAYDIAVALWPLRKKDAETRQRYLSWMLEGYHQETELGQSVYHNLDWFFRLRTAFMYQYHVHKWAAEGVPDDRVVWLERLAADLGKPAWF